MIPEIHPQLQLIKNLWDGITVVPEDLTPWGFPNLTKLEISNSLGGLIEIAAQLENYKEYEPPKISVIVLRQNMASLQAYVTSHIPSNPQPHIPGIFGLIESIRSTLLSWLESADKKGKYATQNLLRSLAEAVSSMKDAEQLYKNLLDSNNNVLNIAANAKLEADAIGISKNKIEADLEKAEGLTEEVAATHKIAIKNASDIKESTVDLNSLKGELEKNKTQQAELFNKFESYQMQINDLIGAASQVGMAASFRDMKMDFERSLKLWLLAFVGAVLVLAEIGVLYIAPAVVSKEWVDILIKLPLSIPLVWLGWFFAKQYGYTVRLREDYAFKYSTAMSFEAHKREAKEIDEELLKKLLDISIQNFADNPLRIFGGENHASPSHEFLESLLKNEGLINRLRDAYEKIFKSKPKSE